MIEETMREIVRNRIIKILEGRLGKELAVEVEKKLSNEEKGRILKEYEKNGILSEETYHLIQSKYCFRDLTSVLFGISSNIRVYPEITDSLIGSGKSGLKGLRKHVRELGYSEDKFEEIIQAIHSEIRKLARDSKYSELLATASLEIGVYYLDFDIKKAEEFLLEAFELRTNLYGTTKALRLLNSLIQICSVYNRVKKTEKAVTVFEKVQTMIRELGGAQKLDTTTISTLKEIAKKLDRDIG
ncbi:MAG: tetratricopeptide repeat protein [Archaeoglobaceae archaeon]